MRVELKPLSGAVCLWKQMQPGGKVNMRKHDIHGTPAENLQRLITDCGVSPHKVGPVHIRPRLFPC
jgi:hypothetical protein